MGPRSSQAVSCGPARPSWLPQWVTALVDVELVTLGVLHPHRVVIEAVGAQGSSERGPEIRQPPGLGVDSLHAGGEWVRTAAADVDVELEAVLDHLGVRHHMEPDAGAVTAGIDDAVRADSQLTVGKPDVAPPVVPGSEPFGGRFKHVSQGSRPEAGKQLWVLAVDDELESGRHRAPIGSAVAQGARKYATGKGRVNRRALRPRCRGTLGNAAHTACRPAAVSGALVGG